MIGSLELFGKYETNTILEVSKVGNIKNSWQFRIIVLLIWAFKSVAIVGERSMRVGFIDLELRGNFYNFNFRYP